MATTKESKKSEEKAMTPPPSTTAMSVYDYGEDEGKGFENQTSKDTAIPWLVVCQPMSPMVTDGRCRPGDLFNTLTEQIWEGHKGVLLVAGTTRHVAVEKEPTADQPDGGIYRGEHDLDSELVRNAIKSAKEFNKWKTPTGNNLIDTFYIYGALSGEDGLAESMFAMSLTRTKIRPYRQWMGKLRQAIIRDDNGKVHKPPLYANVVRLTTHQEKQKNGKGTYYIPVFKSADPRGIKASLIGADDERFQMAKLCGALVSSGEAKIDYAQEVSNDEDGGAEQEAGAPANVRRPGDAF